MSKAAELANLIGNINAGGGGVNRNVIINGAFTVKQRAGTGTQSTDLGATDGYHLHDRWNLDFANTAGRLTMSHDSSAPSGFANSVKLACTTADTSIASDEQFKLEQKIEGQNLQAFAKGTSDAKPFALSFYVKGNASATYVCELFDLDNSRQCSKTFNVTTDWTRVELTFPADTTGAFDDDNAASLALTIFLHAGSDRTSGTLNSSGFASSTNANRAAGISSFFDSTDRTFFITGVQLEVGQNPTEFEHEPFERTLAKCQRYYQEIFMFHDAGSQYIRETIPFKVEMRTSPTGTVFAQTNSGGGTNTSGKIYQGSGENTASVLQENKTSARLDVTAGGFTANQDVYGRVTLASEL
jgi:hypothetical protein